MAALGLLLAGLTSRRSGHTPEQAQVSSSSSNLLFKLVSYIVTFYGSGKGLEMHKKLIETSVLLCNTGNSA